MAKYLYSGRSELHKAAFQRLKDAQVLAIEKRWQGAMYLAGYCIECRLKVKLMEMHNAHNMDELKIRLSQKTGQDIELATHNIESLLVLADAYPRLRANRKIFQSFQTCSKWTPQWRYNPDEGTREMYETFMEAVSLFSNYILNNL